MPWVPFTAADVKARLAVRELDVYEETATEEDDETPGTEERLPTIVAQVLGQFRGAIRGNPHVTGLGPEGTLPDFCIAWAAVIARVALIGLNAIQEGMPTLADKQPKDCEDLMSEIEAKLHGWWPDSVAHNTAVYVKSETITFPDSNTYDIAVLSLKTPPTPLI